MRKKYSFLIATSIFLLLLVPSIGMAEVDEDVMTPGDTFVYKVSQFDVPWEDLLGDMEAPFPLEDFVFDLSGSTLGVKVMGVDANDGFYALNAYVILGKSIEIPIPEESLTPEIEDIFGDTFIIPEGVGLGIGSYIPGSDFLEFIDSDFEDYPGLPFYLDPNSWDDYETMFEDLGEELEDMDLTTTIDNDGDEFKLTIEGEDIGPDADIDVMLEVIWHRTGDYEGIFKSISAEASAKLLMVGEVTMPYYTSEPWSWPYTSTPAGIGSADDTISVEIAFDKKKHNPLPDEILDEETITLEMDTVSFTYETTDFFDEADEVQDFLGEMEDQLDDAEGEDIFEFEVTDVEGCYYETTISQYDGRNLEEIDDPVWWNGFVGSPGWLDDWSDGPWEKWTIYPSSTAGIFPLIAPGITPDWDMWQASTKSISSIVEILEKTLTSSDAEGSLGDIGITLNTFEMDYEMRGNNDYKFFYFTGEVDLVFDSTEYVDWPSEDPEEPYADVTVSFEIWMGYTSDGLIASIGVDLTVDASIEEFPVGEDYNSETYEYTTIYADGTLSMELNAEILNKDIDDIPNPTALPKDTEGEDGDGGVPTPGFSIIPALILVAAISVFIKRRK